MHTCHASGDYLVCTRTPVPKFVVDEQVYLRNWAPETHLRTHPLLWTNGVCVRTPVAAHLFVVDEMTRI